MTNILKIKNMLISINQVIPKSNREQKVISQLRQIFEDVLTWDDEEIAAFVCNKLQEKLK